MVSVRSTTASCPDDDALGAFVEGRLDRAALRRIGEHLRGCDACCELVERYASAWQLDAPATRATDAPMDLVGDAGLAPGQAFARFVLLHRVGRGGMADVHAAYDPVLDRRVALKLLHDVEGGHERALREAQTLAALSHPNIVQIFDVGRAHGRDYIAMEYVEGTLAHWLAHALAGGPRDADAIVEAFRQAGLGLAAAHACGVVHRDFKPANVLVAVEHGRLGRVRVADFGLALPVGGAGGRAGTRGYVAPEQAAGASPDPLADQYSFCVALHEALGGGPAELTESEPAEGATPRARVRTRHGARRIAAALARGMDPDPRRRFDSMSALLEALAPRQRRWVPVVAVGVVATVVLGLAVPTRAEPCATSGALRDELLDPTALDTARGAFAATELPYAEATWRRAHATLTTRADAWAQRAADRCTAGAPVHHDACELRQRAELEQTLALFTRADATTVTHADDVLDALAAAECGGDATAIDAPAPAVDAALLSALVAAKALRLAGHASAARLELERIVDAAREAGDGALRREAQLVLGTILPGFGETDAARAMLAEVAYAALAEGDDVVAGEAMTRVVVVEAMRSPPDEASERWSRDAAAVLARLGDPPQARAKLASARGALRLAAGDLDGAIMEFRDALASTAAAQGEDHRMTADAARNLGLALFRAGQLDEAHAVVSRSLTIRERQLGAHPDVAGSLDLLAAIEFSRGDFEANRAHARQALSIYEGTYGADHLDTINARLHLGVALEDTLPQEARELVAGAVDSLERVVGPDHHQTARARFDLAQIEFHLGHYAEAHAAGRAAHAGLRAAFGESAIETVAAGLAVGGALIGLRRFDEARPWLVDALAHSEHAPPVRRAVAHDRLARLERETGDFARAAALSDAGAAAWAEAYGPDHPEAVASRDDAARARAGRR